MQVREVVIANYLDGRLDTWTPCVRELVFLEFQQYPYCHSGTCDNPYHWAMRWKYHEKDDPLKRRREVRVMEKALFESEHIGDGPL